MKLFEVLYLFKRLLCFFILTIFCVKASAQLKANFTSTTPEGCSPLVVYFTDNSTGAPTQWIWDLGNGATSTDQNPSAIYITPGKYTITLTVKNATGENTVIKNDFIVVHKNPTVIFSANPLEGCAPLNVSFTDNSTPGDGSITSWVWDFGDGTASTLQNPDHLYNISDTFSITLTAINNFGCRQTVQKKDLVQIGGLVQSGFIYTYTNVCKPPATVNFQNTSASNSSLNYQWFFGDGTNSISKNPVHVYNTSGNFTVKLVAQNQDGCSNTYQQVINIGAAKADFNYTAGCANQPVIFTDSSSPVPISETWDFGDGTTENGNIASHTFNGAGSFKVTLTANFGECTDVITKTITTGIKPTASFTATGNTKTCMYPVDIQFNNTSSGAASYEWDFGDGTTSQSANPKHTFTNGGNYTVTLIAFNKNGCGDTVVRTDLIQLGPPKILGIENIPYQGCAPQTITFRPVLFAPDPITSYKWTFSDGGTSTDSVPVHTFTQTGSYNITLVVSTGKGCFDSITIANAVLLGRHPKAGFAAKPLQSCAGDPIHFNDASTGIVTDWLWVFGDGGTSSEQNPVYKYTDTGYFSVTLIVSQNGCTDTLVKPKYVYLKPPVAKFRIDHDCSNPYIFNFNDNSISPQTWYWNFGDGLTDNNQNITHKFADTGVYYISLKVTNDQCIYTTYDTLQVVNEKPSFNYKALHTNFCKYDSVKFFATQYNPGNIKSFYWDFNDGTANGYSENLDTVYHSYLTAGNYLPELSVKDIYNCTYAVKKPLPLMIYGPAAAFSNTGGCLNSIVNFTDESAADGIHAITKWIWDYGDSSDPDTLLAPPFIHAYTNTGFYNAGLKVMDINGCYDTLKKDNAVEITQPVADFFTDSLSCANNILQFLDSSAGELLSYQWDFGDGGFASVINPQHAYNAVGSYSVKLTVTDKYGCTDTLLKPGFINVSNPVAAFILTDSLFTCPPANMIPQNTSGNYMAVTWDFGDGNTSSEVNPAHYYTTAGIYDIRLIAQGYGAACFDTITKKFVLKGPGGAFSYGPFNGCNPLSISLAAKTKNTIQYIWDLGNGVTTTSGDSLTQYTYTTTGRFLPQLIIVDSGGCKVPVVNKDTIVVYGADAKFGTENSSVCDSVIINFIDSSTSFLDNIISYKWSFGDNDSTTLHDPSHTYFQSGSYYPALSVITERGCISNYVDTLNITIAATPKIDALIPDSACAFSPIPLSASVISNQQPGISWVWDFGNGDTVHSQNANYLYTTTGKFPVILISNTAAGCADTVKHSIQINPAPVVDAGPDTVICLGTSNILLPAGAQSYTWLADASLSCNNCNNPVVTPLSTTEYFVSGKNKYGCAATDSVVVEVKQPADVSIVAPDSICVGSTINLTAGGAEIYNWQPVNLVTQASGAQTASTPPSTTIFTLIGTDSKGCFRDTAFTTVHVFPYPVLQIPDSIVSILSGTDYRINTIGSEDIVSWQWIPVNTLSCNNCAQPLASPKTTTTYTVDAKNVAGCTVRKNITITVLCKNENMFIPNTFSPNGDGMNDYFYPRGKGYTVKSFRIFSRWGNIVFEQSNFAPNNQSYGWNGTFKGKALQPDVYVFIVEIMCDNGQIFTSRGNVTLLR